MDFRVLGPLEVRVRDRIVDVGGHRQRRLLAALLIGHGAAVSTADLVDAVWDEPERPAGADRALRMYVSRLRRSFTDGASDDMGAASDCLRTAARAT